MRRLAALLAVAALTMPAAAKPLAPRAWHVLGPFPVGKTEYDGDPLEAYGGIAVLTPGDQATLPFVWSEQVICTKQNKIK